MTNNSIENNNNNSLFINYKPNDTKRSMSTMNYAGIRKEKIYELS